MPRTAILIASMAVLASITFGRNGTWNDDIELLGDAFRKNPRSARIAANLGIAYYHQNDILQAIEMSERSLSIVPNAISHNNLGNVHARMGRFDAAVVHYTRALVLSLGHTDYYNNRGIAYFNLGEYDKAIADYSAAIRLQPDYSKAYMNRGNAYDEKGEVGRAIDDYSRGLRIDPMDTDIYYNRGVALRNAGNEAAAEADFRKACDQGHARACSMLK